MVATKTAKSNKKVTETPELLHAILQELRLLRNDMMLLFPQDNLEDYANADRVKDSYEKAVREHPPASLSWK